MEDYEAIAAKLANALRDTLKVIERSGEHYHDVRSLTMNPPVHCTACHAKRVLRAFDNGVTDEDQARETMERNQARR